MRQYIRIIGGQHRGKKINFPDVPSLRPTPDRVRETLFNWLMHDIRGAHCLDAFAGSGGLGFEAYSRGAGRVLLLEIEPIIYANLSRWADSFACNKLNVSQQDACTYFTNTPDQFDVIFLDPPFNQLHLLDCIQTIATRSVLKTGGWLYLESPHDINVPNDIFEKVKQKRCGQVLSTLYRKRRLTSDASAVSIN